jgi:hypothetical protein
MSQRQNLGFYRVPENWFEMSPEAKVEWATAVAEAWKQWAMELASVEAGTEEGGEGEPMDRTHFPSSHA